MRVLVCKPVLDLPFKRPRLASAELRRHFRSAETAAIRRPWGDVAGLLAAAFARSGHRVRLLERPNWELTPRLIGFWAPDLALVPHRSAHQFEGLACPALYYMQMYCRWVFTVDPLGWGARSSVYGSDAWRAGDAGSGAAERYRALLIERRQSKLGQPDSITIEGLRAEGALPREPYVFVPCQIPHDETLLYHSPVGMAEFAARLAQWANARRVHVAFKGHPANPGAMDAIRAAAPVSAFVHWTDGHVHDLVATAQAVFTVNSGVGFEALLQDKPVAAFGHAEYDVVTYQGRASLTGFDQAWAWVGRVREDPAAARLAQDYRTFVDWYVNRHALALGSDTLDERLAAVVAQGEALVAAAGQ